MLTWLVAVALTTSMAGFRVWAFLGNFLSHEKLPQATLACFSRHDPHAGISAHYTKDSAPIVDPWMRRYPWKSCLIVRAEKSNCFLCKKTVRKSAQTRIIATDIVRAKAKSHVNTSQLLPQPIGSSFSILCERFSEDVDGFVRERFRAGRTAHRVHPTQCW